MPAQTPPPTGQRARRREATEADILRVAREHLAAQGAAALSLRAIARDLGMVSSGLYRYVPGRDDLLTRLIIDSYRSLSHAVHAAHDVVEPSDLEGRWAAMGFALRSWALDHPHDFALLYGSPVPDYQAPADRTVEPGTEVLSLVLKLLQDAHEQGRLAAADKTTDDTEVETEAENGAENEASDAVRGVGPMLTEPFFSGISVDAAGIARGLSAWTLLLGAVTSEVFGQLGELPDAAALFRVHLTTAGSLMLAPPHPSTGFSTGVCTA